MIIPATQENIARAASVIKTGGVVAFPTETVYGLGADAKNPGAIRRIFEIKGRPSTNPLIIHIPDPQYLNLAVELPERGLMRDNFEKLRRFWPGPLSLVLPKRGDIPLEATAGRYTAAVRVPAHPVALSLIQASDCAVAAPSANRSDYISPTTAQHVAEDLGDKVDLILDGGPCPGGLESTVLSLIEDPPLILRPGLVTRETLESVLGKVAMLHDFAQRTPAPSPGLSSKHYSPRTKLVFDSDIPAELGCAQAGLISFNDRLGRIDPSRFRAHIRLSLSGDLGEAASRLYAALREMDEKNLELIVIQRCEDSGLGLAIMDRLQRAVGK